jgi:hypothetical protein
MPGGIGGNFNPQPQNTLPISSFGAPSNFSAGASQQASDYDTIMKQYQNFTANAAQSPATSQNVSTTNVAPQTANYTQSADVTNSLANLSDLSQTGGYTQQGIADIRERDISPTRSVYANAQQNVERAKALGGGYSPNFDATQASMARDESNQIAGIDTAANAGIAQNVAANRLAAASPYAAASSTANAAQTQNNEFNANAVNATNEANAGRNLQAGTGNADRNLAAQFQNRGNILQGIQGQTNLYGTTPALTNTFGNQVMQAGQLGQGQQNIDQNKNNAIYRMGGVM